MKDFAWLLDACGSCIRALSVESGPMAAFLNGTKRHEERAGLGWPDWAEEYLVLATNKKDRGVHWSDSTAASGAVHAAAGRLRGLVQQREKPKRFLLRDVLLVFEPPIQIGAGGVGRGLVRMTTHALETCLEEMRSRYRRLLGGHQNPKCRLADVM